MEGQLPFIVIVLIEAVVIIFLIISNIRLNKKNKGNDKVLTVYKEKLREDELDEAIKNPYYKQDKSEADWKKTPYEVEFKDEEDVRTADAVCVHLQCTGRLVTKKYLINISDELYLGRSKNNGVIFDEEDVDQRQIHFVRKSGELYIANVSADVPVVFVRKDSRYELTDVLVKVNDGDELLFKESRIVISLI